VELCACAILLCKFSLCIFLLLSEVGILVFRNAEVPNVGISDYRGAEGRRFGLPKRRCSAFRTSEMLNIDISDLRSRQQRNLSLFPVYKSKRVPVFLSLLLELAWEGPDFMIFNKDCYHLHYFKPCSLLQRVCSSTSCIQYPQVYHSITISLRPNIIITNTYNKTNTNSHTIMSITL